MNVHRIIRGDVRPTCTPDAWLVDGYRAVQPPSTVTMLPFIKLAAGLLSSIAAP